MNNCIITISREFGSGGRMIGRAVAETLGFKCYDKTVAQFASRQSGLSQEFIDNAETDARSSLLFGLSVGGIAPLQDKVFTTQAQIIKNLAREQSCVFIGRCADYVLRDKNNCLNVFIHAPIESRIKRARECYNITESNIKSYINKKDKARAGYYSIYADGGWGNARNYHLCINSDMGIEAAEAIITAAAKQRFGL